jgi:CRP/FNR family transcriptional regulator, cyclic AMP receptor protein
VPNLAALPEPAKRALADEFDEVDAPLGERIVSHGDFAYELFAILEGTARVEQDGETIATLGPGELCGEIGLLLTGRRTARSSPRRRCGCSPSSTRPSGG